MPSDLAAAVSVIQPCSMNPQLHSEIPDQALRPLFTELCKDAVFVDIAVAFVSKHGVKEIEALVKNLKARGTARLLVSVMRPSDLEEINTRLVKNVELHEKIEVGIHLGYPNRFRDGSYGQFHSKFVFIERGETADTARSIVVGSHNWAENGLDRGNLEASLVFHGTDDDSAID
jgi:hypothetical protein